MSCLPSPRSGSPASPASSSSCTSSPRPVNSTSDDDQPDNDLYPQPTTAPTNPVSTDDDYQFQSSQPLSRISVENVNQGMLHMLKTFHLVNSQATQDDDFDDHHQHFQPEHHLPSPTSPPPDDLQKSPTAQSTPSPSRSLRTHSSARNSTFSGLGNGHDLSGGSLRASSILAIHRSLSQQPLTEPRSQSDLVSDGSQHPESDDGDDSSSEPERDFTLESPTGEANPDPESGTLPKYHNRSPCRAESIPFPPSNGPTFPLGSTVSHSDSSLTVNNMARTITIDSHTTKSQPSSRRHHAHPNRKASLAKKLQQVFQLPTEEEVLGEYSCWLFHSVHLKGYLYLTAGHVCFYAYLKNNGKEADDDGDVIKAGMLTRRHSHKLKQHRQVKSWFILKDSILSWYPSSHEPYFPTGQIDLHFCTKIESSSDAKRPNQFKLYVSSKVYTFSSDTQQTKKDWVKVLQEAVFACQHHGQNVKIAIPLTAVESVEQCDSMQFAQTIRVKTKDRAGAVPALHAQATSTLRDPSDAVLDDYFFGFIQESQALFELIKTTLQVVQASDNLPLATTDPPDLQVALGSVSMPATPTVFTSPCPPCQFGPIRDSTRPIVHPPRNLLKKHTRHSSLLPKLSPDPAGLVHISSGVYESTSRPSAEERRHGSTLTARLKKISSTGNRLVGSPIRPAANLVKVQPWSGGNGGPSGEQSPASPRTPSPLMMQSTPPLGGLLKPPSPSINGSSPTESQLGESHTYPPSHRTQYSTQAHQESAESSPRFSRPVSPNPAGQSSSNSWGLLPGWLKGVPSNLNPIKPAKGAINTAKNLLTSGGDSSSETPRKDTSDESLPEEEEAGLAHEEGQLSERDEHKFRAEFNFLNNPGTASESQNEMRLLLKTNCELTRGGMAVYGQIFLATPVETGTAWHKSGRRACVCFKGRRRIPHGVTKMILPLEELVKVQADGNRLGLLTVQTDVLVKPETVWFEFGSADQMRAVEAELGRLIETQKQREQDKEGDSDEATVPFMFQSTSSSFLTFKPQNKLHITCLTIGSRGDVQPYIALCQRLQSDGHTCRIASHGEYRSWVESYGIEYVEIGGDPAELMKICVDNGTFTLGFLKEALSKFRGWLDELLSSSYDACKGTDLLIESPSTMAGIHIAEALEIPYFRAFTMPWTRTREYPHAFAVPDRKMGSGYNYMTYTVFDQVFWRAMAGQVNRWRKETLGLKSTSWEKLESHKVPFLYNFSPTIVPTPLDWFEWVHITGYWFIEEDKVVDGTETKRPQWEPEKGLVKFLDRAKVEGKKVVYIGFGSIVVPDPEALTKTVVEAVEAAGVYAVVSKGWSDRLAGNKEDKPNVKGKGKQTEEHETIDRDETELLEPNSNIYNVSSVPHDWLFPRIDAACHHGGAGTTGASLKAGIPTIIRPFFGDQFFWAERVETLGIGSGVRKMTVKALSQALITATTDEVQIKKAKLVGEQLRSESGTAKAVECIYRDLEYAKSLIKRRPKVVEGSSKLPSSTSTLVKAPADQVVEARPKARPLQAQAYSSYTKQASGSQSKASTVRSGETNQDSMDKSVLVTSDNGVADHPSPVAQLLSPAQNKPTPGSSKPVNIPQQATNTSDEDSSWDILSQSRSDDPVDLSSSFDNL